VHCNKNSSSLLTCRAGCAGSRSPTPRLRVSVCGTVTRVASATRIEGPASLTRGYPADQVCPTSQRKPRVGAKHGSKWCVRQKTLCRGARCASTRRSSKDSKGWGVDAAFGGAGENAASLLLALKHSTKIKPVIVRHEQAASFMACGYAIYSNRLGVCFATAGPGAFNLFSGLAVAMSDSLSGAGDLGLFIARVDRQRRPE